MLNVLQKYQRSKLEVDKKSAGSAGPGHIEFELAELAIFFVTSNFDLKCFCNLLTYKNVQYLIWKIWFISVWSLKPKTCVCLLTGFMLGQSTLISYYTKANGYIFSAAGVCYRELHIKCHNIIWITFHYSPLNIVLEIFWTIVMLIMISLYPLMSGLIAWNLMEMNLRPNVKIWKLNFNHNYS